MSRGISKMQIYMYIQFLNLTAPHRKSNRPKNKPEYVRIQKSPTLKLYDALKKILVTNIIIFRL